MRRVLMWRGVLRWSARRRAALRAKARRGGPDSEARYAALQFAKFVGLAFLVSAGIALGLTALALSGLESGSSGARRALIIYFSMLTLGGLAAAFLLTYALGGVMILRPYFALRRTEAKLRARAHTARRLALVAEHASDMVLILDAAGLIEWANAAFYRAMDFEPDDVIGLSPQAALGGARTDPVAERRLASALSMRREETAELFAHDAHGAARLLEMRLTPVEGRSRHLRFIVVMRDITERHEAEQRLSEAVNLLDDAFTLFDPENRLMVFNEAYCALIGAKPGELRIGMSLVELGAILKRAGLADFGGRSAEAWARRVSADMRAGRGDDVLRGPGGATHMFRSAVLATGELASLRIDVSELQAARMKAEEAVRLKSRILANISHEVRTPLNGVIAMAELLLESDLSEDQRAGLELISRSGDALLAMLNDILDFSKIEEGKMTLNAARFRPEEAFGDAAALMAPQARRKGLQISFDADGPGPEVMGDAGRLRQIAGNLVGNAVKFTTEGHVRVRYSHKVMTDVADISLEVEDSGVGIAPESLSAIFQPFEQGERLDATLMQEGTGLGLSISRQLAALMGGEITAQSTPGQGSSFRFSVNLPLARPILRGERDGSDQADRAPPACLGGDGAPPVVLIVEDNPTNATIIAAMLRADNLRLEFRETGAEALDAFDALKPTAVLMDLHLPDMDGYAVTRALREAEERWPGARTPVIAATASSRADTSAARDAAGMDDFVAKPFAKDDLRGVLGRWLDDPRRDLADTG